MSFSTMPPGDDWIPRRFETLDRRIRELTASVAKSLKSTVARLTDLVERVEQTLENITATVQTAISANSYTQTVIDQKVANPPSGSAVTGNVTATGSVSAGGSMTTGGDLKVAGALRAPQVPVTILTSNYFATYATTNDGKLGHVPSSAQFKQDIRATTFDPAKILGAEIVDFRYRAEVERLGDAAPYIVGGIAEQFHAAGLGEFVSYDDEENPYGIAYERLAVGIIPLLQQMHARIAALESK